MQLDRCAAGPVIPIRRAAPAFSAEQHMRHLGIASTRQLDRQKSDERRARANGWIVAVAHELAQPIAAMAAHGQAGQQWLDRAEVPRDEVRANLDQIVRNALRAGEILRCVRALSGSGELELVKFDLNELIATSVAQIEPEFARNDVRLHIDLPPTAPHVLGDRVLLKQAIVNLLRNGLDAMASVQERPRELRVRARWRDVGGICVTVEDNGVGIDGEDLDRPFQSFFTTKANGMGVGLSLCRTIVESHGGSIWAARNEGPGAAFHIVLPAALTTAA
jgi:signal transduction histidine kinase